VGFPLSGFERLTVPPGSRQSAFACQPVIQSLLVLQDRDLKRLGLEGQLKGVPGDIARVEQKIAAEKAAIESARVEIARTRDEKEGVELEIGSAEEKLGRYKTQQLAVRKNDEYQALGQEIATVQGQIGELEGRELEIMYSIDEAKKRLPRRRRN
jgi:predicted  nucleic acid-binding Zn-ribbon protein